MEDRTDSYSHFLVAIVYSPKPGGDTLSLDRYDSSVARIQNWGQTITRIRERPVFGYGFNVVPFLDKEAASALPGQKWCGIDSSILLLRQRRELSDSPATFWLMGNQLALARSKDSALTMILYASMTAIAVHSLFLNSLFYPWVMVWMWVLLGTIEKSEARNSK